MAIQRQKKISLSEAKSRILNFCVKRERAHEEVRQKLLAWGVHPDHTEDLIGFLISENFLNEERYAKAYCHDRFLFRKWGKLKIVQGLKEKKISEFCIRLALEEISDEEYEKMIFDVGEGKRSRLSGDSFEIRNKLYRFLLQRGFEPEGVRKYLNQL
ncbi:RecX family transcriptional regulator [bacterium SCSIO 12741]|nr:RecX family transcriptional regulator [bacterium SCSIO 12741]